MEWKPLYPNNMPCNGLDGYYCVMLHCNNGIWSGRKYTIVFQHKEIDPGSGHIDKASIDRYILFEKSYYDINGPHKHPIPSDDHPWDCNSKDTFTHYDVNDYGGFVYAYENMEDAKKRAKTQYDHIYGYVASFLPKGS